MCHRKMEMTYITQTDTAPYIIIHKSRNRKASKSIIIYIPVLVPPPVYWMLSMALSICCLSLNWFRLNSVTALLSNFSTPTRTLSWPMSQSWARLLTSDTSRLKLDCPKLPDESSMKTMSAFLQTVCKGNRTSEEEGLQRCHLFPFADAKYYRLDSR